MGQEECESCGQRVYLMERLAAENHIFHRACFKCQICSTHLKPGSYEYDLNTDQFYCRTHYRELLRHRSVKRTMEQRGLTMEEKETEVHSPKRKKKFATTAFVPEQGTKSGEGSPVKTKPSLPSNNRTDALQGVGLQATPTVATPTDISREDSEKIRGELPSLLKALAGEKGKMRNGAGNDSAGSPGKEGRREGEGVREETRKKEGEGRREGGREEPALSPKKEGKQESEQKKQALPLRPSPPRPVPLKKIGAQKTSHPLPSKPPPPVSAIAARVNGRGREEVREISSRVGPQVLAAAGKAKAVDERTSKAEEERQKERERQELLEKEIKRKKEQHEREVREREAREREARKKEAKEKEAKEREARERKAKEREAREREAREREAREREAREREAREKEARERERLRHLEEEEKLREKEKQRKLTEESEKERRREEAKPVDSRVTREEKEDVPPVKPPRRRTKKVSGAGPPPGKDKPAEVSKHVC